MRVSIKKENKIYTQKKRKKQIVRFGEISGIKRRLNNSRTMITFFFLLKYIYIIHKKYYCILLVNLCTFLKSSVFCIEFFFCCDHIFSSCVRKRTKTLRTYLYNNLIFCVFFPRNKKPKITSERRSRKIKRYTIIENNK
jgi:hypothetical protein